MVDLKEILDAIEGPAVLIGADGVVVRNSVFEGLPAPVKARAKAASPPPGWRSVTLPDGSRLVSGDATGGSEGRGLLAQERTLATLSHEIRTPLNGVLGMAGLLARTRLDATQRAYLAALTESGEHLLELVNEVLDFAKLDAGRLSLELAPTDIERLLQGVAELLSPRAHAGGIEIAWAALGPPPMVMADDGRLRQILFNLAGNAVKMTEKGGVLITAECRGPAEDGRRLLRFAVRDTGPGLDPAAQARIFEEFEQTSAGARAGGAGLGLAIVRRLAEAFGGRVGVDSQPGEGAVFWFEAAFAPAAGSAPAAPSLKGLAVAVASRCVVVREAAALQIRTCGGRPLIYESPAEADRQAPRAAVLLVDPGPSAAKPAPPPARRSCLVLLRPEERDAVDAYREAGYAGYLIKPLRRASLAARVLAVLDRPAATTADEQAAPDDERAEAASAAGVRVLLAEDNPVNAMLAGAMLSREGCEVTRVGSGEEAVSAIAAAPYDLVLMDLRMPGMDGLEATRQLRASGVRTPILALTADAYEDDRHACLEAGMDDFLTKPLNLAALRAALARWTRPQEGAKLVS